MGFSRFSPGNSARVAGECGDGWARQLVHLSAHFKALEVFKAFSLDRAQHVG